VSAPSYPYGYGYNPPSNGLDLITIPKAMLAYVVSYFGQAGVLLPSRQMMVAGPAANVPYDCEQLTVTLETLGWGRARDATQLSPTFGKEASVNAQRHGEWVVSLVRCWPTGDDEGNLVDPDLLEEASEGVARDAGLLSQALVNFVAFQPFSESAAIPPGGSVQAGAVSFTGPSGGFIGINGALISTVAELNPPASGAQY
jgi:hypothetical protein